MEEVFEIYEFFYKELKADWQAAKRFLLGFVLFCIVILMFPTILLGYAAGRATDKVLAARK